MSLAPLPSQSAARPQKTARQAPLADRLADALPGWMFCVCGVILLAVVVLTPPWLELHENAWRLDVMQAQAGALRQQTQRYEEFAAAIVADDPVVIERLAMTHLRMSMAGKHPLRVRPVEQDTGDIGAWLSVPQPVLGRDVPFYAVPRNRLVRLVTGPGRPALLAVGLVCLIAGVLFNPRSRPASSRRLATAPQKYSARISKSLGQPRPA